MNETFLPDSTSDFVLDRFTLLDVCAKASNTMRTNIFIRFVFSLVIASVAASVGLAQTGLPVVVGDMTSFPPNLKQYLELSDDQVSQITTLNLNLSQLVSTKTQRQLQLQVEIVQETARPSIDAMAIGSRYAEIEQIRRDIQTERTRTVASAQNILTEAQKGKLTALQQVLRDYPVACAAITTNLMGAGIGASAVNPNLNGPLPGGVPDFSYATFLLGAVSTCPVPTAASRVGAFVSSEHFRP